MKIKSNLSIEDFVDFISDNDLYGVYRGWTRDQIKWEIERSMNEETFIYIQDNKTKEIIGTGTARKLIGDTGIKIMHVSGLLTTRKGLLYVFFKIFREVFPSYEVLGGNHNGKLFAWGKNKFNHIEQLLERL